MLGELLSFGGNLLGGILGSNAQKDANETNARINAENIALQKQFAQNGIQWKVADAKAAGISPLYALGASTSSFSPVSIGAQPEDALGKSMHAMGQDLGRAVNSSASSSTREGIFADQARKLQLEGAGLDNDIKRATLASQVMKMKSAQVGPPIPTDVPIPTAKPSDIKRLYIGGNKIDLDPTTSSAKDFEDRYGDDISWLTAPMIGAADLYNHARQNWVPSTKKFWDGVRKYGSDMYKSRGATWGY